MYYKKYDVAVDLGMMLEAMSNNDSTTVGDSVTKPSTKLSKFYTILRSKGYANQLLQDVFSGIFGFKKRPGCVRDLVNYHRLPCFGVACITGNKNPSLLLTFDRLPAIWFDESYIYVTSYGRAVDHIGSPNIFRDYTAFESTILHPDLVDKNARLITIQNGWLNNYIAKKPNVILRPNASIKLPKNLTYFQTGLHQLHQVSHPIVTRNLGEYVKTSKSRFSVRQLQQLVKPLIMNCIEYGFFTEYKHQGKYRGYHFFVSGKEITEHYDSDVAVLLCVSLGWRTDLWIAYSSKSDLNRQLVINID
jgi:hypothetical protein